jgi:hypothetical protein
MNRIHRGRVTAGNVLEYGCMDMSPINNQQMQFQYLVAMLSQTKKLMELQGQMAVNLIDSAKVTAPQSSEPGLGTKIDIEI